jgi:hypothetical protein
MKEGGGEDHLAIAWQYPGQSRVVIPAKFSRLALVEVQQTHMVRIQKKNRAFPFSMYHTILTLYLLCYYDHILEAHL